MSILHSFYLQLKAISYASPQNIHRTCKNEFQALSSYPPKFPSLEYNTSHQDCLATNSEFQLANSLITVKILFFRLSFEIDCNGRATGALDAAGTTNWRCGIRSC